MITFDVDDEIDLLHPGDGIEQLATLLSFLCGQKISLASISKEAEFLVNHFLNRVRVNGESNVNLSCQEFNELLLLFNQHRIERSFFDFFFLAVDPRSDEIRPNNFIAFAQLKDGVKRFRGFAMLCFGNFRFAFRRLSEEENPNEFMQCLDPCNRDSKREMEAIEKRQEPLTPLIGTKDLIEADKTWFLGYLSPDFLKNDAQTLDRMIQEFAGSASEESLERLRSAKEKLVQLTNDLNETLIKGKRNSIKYLTWDYLDIYIATSMRDSWEFSETYSFIKKLFLEELHDIPKIRWFDPTQSYYDNIIDKGLLERLMLKRAKCTIYMAQEGDTLGKDSELAATLAQGKPVIAFVREIQEDDLMSYAEELKQKPVKYFRQRLLTLLADGFFDKPDNRKRVYELSAKLGLKLAEDDLKREALKLLKTFSDLEDSRLFELIGSEETEFWEAHSAKMEFAVKLLSAIDSRAADNRADTIKNKHPLGIQVHLENGVANGVFVARNLRECANLVRGILTWDMKFDIKTILEPNKGEKIATALIEKETKSRFRVVTKDECLTNSFWNFYLDTEQSRWYNKMGVAENERRKGSYSS